MVNTVKFKKCSKLPNKQIQVRVKRTSELQCEVLAFFLYLLIAFKLRRNQYDIPRFT